MIINLPKLGPVRFRDDISQEELTAQIGRLSKQYGFTMPKPDVGIGTIAKRGFQRSLGELGIATTDTIPAIVGSSLGFNSYAKQQMGEAAQARAQLEQQYPTRFKSYQDVNGLGEAAEFGAETLGELGPSALGALVPGVGAGAVASRIAGQAALKQGLSTAAAKVAGQQAGKRAMYGGVYFGSAAQNVPEVFENIYRESNKFEPGLAALAGGLSSVLDSIVPGQVLNQMGAFGRQKAIAEMAKKTGAAPKVIKALTASAAKTAAAEGLTEGTQEAISATAERIAGSTKDIFAPENIQRYKEAFVKGAIGGGTIGAVGGVGQQVGIGQERRQRLEDIQAQRGARDQARAGEQAVNEFVNQPQAPVGQPVEQPTSMTQEEAQTRFGEAFNTLPDLQARMAQIDQLRAQQEQEAPGSPRHNAFQENINVVQDTIQKDFGRNTLPDQSLKVTPEVIKGIGLGKNDKFSKFINGMDLQDTQTLEKLIRTVENPLPSDPSFGGSPRTESAYNKLINATPQDVVAQIREKIKPTVEQLVIPEPQVSQAQIEQSTPQEDVAPRMQSLNDLANIDPNNSDDVAEVLKFGDTVTDKRVQKQLKLWTDLNVPDNVMGDALAKTAEPLQDAEEAQPQQEEPVTNATKNVTKVTPEQDQSTDPVENLLAREDYKPSTPEKDAHTYFDAYDPDLALMSVAHDLVNQPTEYRNDPRFKGQGGQHAKQAEQWIRANLPPPQVKEFDNYIQEAQRQKDTADATPTVVDNALPLPEKEKPAKETKPKVKIEDVLRNAARQYDASKGRNLKADAEASALQTKAHPSVHKELRANNLTQAVKNISNSPSSKTAGDISRKLQPHLKNVKVNYGAKESSFDPITNTVNLRKDATEYEVLHEATHAAVSHVIDNKNHQVTKQLQKLFDQARNNLDPVYGAQNLQEFVAEAWSNNDFRNQLDSIRDTTQPRSNMSLWDRIVDMVRKVLGLGPRKNPSVLDSTDSLLNEIVSPPPDKRTGGTLYAQSINDPKLVDRIHENVDNLIKQAPLMNEARATTFWSNLEKLTTKGKELAYKTLNLSALGQVAKNVFGGTGIEFSDTVNKMSGYQENLQERAQPLHNRLQKFAKDKRYQEWSTLVHDSTKVDVDPNALKSKYKDDPEKFNAWDDLHKRFNKMTPEMQRLYKDLFTAYKTLNDETMKSLEGNILASIPDQELAKSTYKKILTQLAQVNVDHYAPLFRRGIYRLDYTKNGDRVQEFYTTQAERTTARKKLDKATDIDEYTQSDTMTLNNIPSGTILSQLVNIMKENGANDKAVEQVANLVARAMPETSMWKHRMKREGISGYIDDAALAFDNVSSSTIHQLSRLKYSGDLNKLLEKMEGDTNQLRGPEQERARLLLEEFKARHEFAMNPNISAFAQMASTWSFFYFLAGNVSSAVVNTLQLPLIVGPQLGGEYGFGAATKALNHAMQMYTSGGFRRKINDISGNEVEEKAMWSLENAVNNGKAPQYKGLLDKLKEYGFLQTSTARDATLAAGKPESAYGGPSELHRKALLVGTFMFHHAERMNREVTAIAAYDLEKNKLSNNKKLSRDEIEAQAIDKAIRAVETMHGAGHTVTGPSLGHSDLGKVLMVFKRFAFSMYYMLWDTMRRALPIKGATGEQLEGIKAARTQLAGIYGMSFLFAGVKGLPLYWIGEMAYNAFIDDDEDDFDTVMRKFLGDLPYKGPLNYFTNLSIADRVGWSDLIFKEGKTDKADASTLSSYIEGIFGAPYAIANNMFRAKDLMADGHYERAVETALPVALKNVLKGGRFATEGVNTLRGDPIMGEVNGYNAAMQALGFAPADLARRYADNEHIKKTSAKLLQTRDKLARQYYIAQGESDFERADEIRDKLFAFGDKHPELGIDEEFLSRSVASRDRISQDLYNGITIPKSLRESLIADIENFK